MIVLDDSDKIFLNSYQNFYFFQNCIKNIDSYLSNIPTLIVIKFD